MAQFNSSLKETAAVVGVGHASTVSRGRSFEQEVTQWLENKLNHRLVHQNEWIECAKNLKPFECDVHTRTSIPYWDKIQKIGVLFIALSMFLLIIMAREIQAALLFFVMGFVMVIVSRIRKQQRNYHVWIECKNLKTKVNRDHIHKLRNTTRLLAENRDAKWKPDFVYCFSATDFERDAIAVANQHKISCYRKSRRGFERVN